MAFGGILDGFLNEKHLGEASRHHRIRYDMQKRASLIVSVPSFCCFEHFLYLLKFYISHFLFICIFQGTNEGEKMMIKKMSTASVPEQIRRYSLGREFNLLESGDIFFVLGI